MLRIREVAKRTAVLSNSNPSINDSLADRDLFAGRLSQEELNNDIEDDLASVPPEFADAVLYKVVHTIETQMAQTQRANRRKHFGQAQGSLSQRDELRGLWKV